MRNLLSPACEIRFNLSSCSFLRGTMPSISMSSLQSVKLSSETRKENRTSIGLSKCMRRIKICHQQCVIRMDTQLISDLFMIFNVSGDGSMSKQEFVFCWNGWIKKVTQICFVKVMETKIAMEIDCKAEDGHYHRWRAKWLLHRRLTLCAGQWSYLPCHWEAEKWESVQGSVDGCL